MKEKIKTFFCVLILLGALPYIITTVLQEKGLHGSGAGYVSSQMQEEDAYLIGVVAKEMSADYELEALKAQMVIARTNMRMAKELNQELPEMISREELQRLWGEENFAGNYQKLSAAAEATRGVEITWQQEPIYADFHAVSAGWTRSGAMALETDKMPWLAEVESTRDIPSEDYLKVVFWDKEELAKKINRGFPEVKIDALAPLDTIKIEGRDTGGYVLKLKIGEKTVTGEEFRNALGLNSACFYLKEVEGDIRIVTKGLGHGLGMSQYGANVMAQEGADYREILTCYYKNIEISD